MNLHNYSIMYNNFELMCYSFVGEFHVYHHNFKSQSICDKTKTRSAGANRNLMICGVSASNLLHFDIDSNATLTKDIYWSVRSY